MKYSHQKPSQSGAYFRRDVARGWTEEIVQVVPESKMGLRRTQELHVDGEPVSSLPGSFEWAGPIEKPK